MTAFRSQTDEQLAARHDNMPWVGSTGQHYAIEPTAGFAAPFGFAPRVECIPSRDPHPVRYKGSTHDWSRPVHNPLGMLLGFPHMYEWAPRPEFARPPVNRVLAAIRTYDDFEAWRSAFCSFDAFGGYDLWEHPKNPFNVFTIASPEEIDHARRVLDLLDAVACEQCLADAGHPFAPSHDCGVAGHRPHCTADGCF